MNQEEFLAHYGVKGMRWGVRRAMKARAASAKKVSSNPSEEGREAREILAKQRQHGTVSLTNKELQVVNARIKLEQDFHKLFPAPPGKIAKAQDFAKKVIKVVDTAGDSVKAADKAKKILTGKFVMSEEAKAAAKVAAEKAAKAAIDASP